MISFDDSLEANYFSKSVSFLEDFRWLVDFKWTNILIEDVLNKVPTNWTEYLNTLDFNQINLLLNDYKLGESAPSDLIQFVGQCDRFSLRLKWPQFAKFELPVERNARKLNKKISIKKAQEVECLLNLILNFCRIDLKTLPENVTILDVGAGLGYISEQLNANGFTVIGVEGDSSLCDSANSRHDRDKIKFVHMKFDHSSECVQEIRSILPEDRPVIVIGLHCCGNLLNSIMEVYLQVHQIKAMLCVTCCYHLISIESIPRSRTLCKVLLDLNVVFSVPMLRLACSDPPQRWTRDLNDSKLELHQKSAFYRALLEKFVKESDTKMMKPMKKNLHSKLDGTIDDFLESIKHGFHESVQVRSSAQMKQMNNQLINLIHIINPLKILQTLIQPIVETVVVLDHIVKLREQEISASGIQVFSQLTSPRNICVVSLKS